MKILNHLVRGHLAVRLDAMFEAVELPAGVPDLATGLPDVDGDALTLWERKADCQVATNEKAKGIVL